MTGEPLAGKTVLAGRGGAEAAQAARVEGNKEDEQQRCHRAVDDGPDGRRGAFDAYRGGGLRGRGRLRHGRGPRHSGGGGGGRGSLRGGLCGGSGGLRRGGGRGDGGGESLPSPALHGWEQAQRRRGKDGQQQAQKRRRPEGAQQPPGQALGKQGPQNGDDEISAPPETLIARNVDMSPSPFRVLLPTYHHCSMSLSILHPSYKMLNLFPPTKYCLTRYTMYVV